MMGRRLYEEASRRRDRFCGLGRNQIAMRKGRAVLYLAGIVAVLLIGLYRPSAAPAFGIMRIDPARIAIPVAFSPVDCDCLSHALRRALHARAKRRAVDKA